MRSFFNSWPALSQKMLGCHIALFLDFDGTLSKLAPTPALARFPAKTKQLLWRLSKLTNVHVAVISGRELANLKRKVGISRIAYGGNHGLEIKGPGFSYYPTRRAESRRILDTLYERLLKTTKHIRGIFLEHKNFSLACHYRRVPKKMHAFIKKTVYDVTRAYIQAKLIRVRPGKQVFEIQLSSRWNKGRAVEWLMRERRFIPYTKPVVPVYIGDDTTDEDAFAVLRKRGITIVVGRRRASRARLYVNTCSDVPKVLSLLYRHMKPH